MALFFYLRNKKSFVPLFHWVSRSLVFEGNLKVCRLNPAWPVNNNFLICVCGVNTSSFLCPTFPARSNSLHNYFFYGVFSGRGKRASLPLSCSGRWVLLITLISIARGQISSARHLFSSLHKPHMDSPLPAHSAFT